jgi:hypothetical protein
MTTTSIFSDYVARLRAFIRQSSADTADTARPSSKNADEAFNSLALELYALQFAHNQPYRRFCDSRGVSPRTISHWTTIPAMPAVAFKETDLTCLPAGERTTSFFSSGTTGQKRSRHFHNVHSLALYESSLLPWFKAHLLAGCGRLNMLFLTPSPALAPHSSLAHMFETLRREFGAVGSLFVGNIEAEEAWRIETKRALFFLRDAIQANRPVALLGTAFNFVQLLDFLAASDTTLRLPEGSRVLETGGYKNRSRFAPKAELHALMTTQLGVPGSHIISEYGMSELSSQAYDSRVPGAECQVPGEDRLFRFPPWARVQIVSPETGGEVGEGERGLIRVLDLANVSSVMAIQTEDLGVRHNNGFEFVGRAESSEPRGCSLMSL